MLMPKPPNGGQSGVEGAQGLNDVFSVAPMPTTTSDAAEDEDNANDHFSRGGARDEPQPTLPQGPRQASLPLTDCTDLDPSASTSRSEITANHAIAAGHTPNTRPWAYDLRCAEPQPAQLLREGDKNNTQLGAATWSSHDSLISCKKDPKMLWAKALWWATQEAGRRRAQILAAEHNAPSRQRRGSALRMRTTIAMAKQVLQTSRKNSPVVPLSLGHVAGGPFAAGRDEEVGGMVGGGGMFKRVAGIARFFGRSRSHMVAPEPEHAPGAGDFSKSSNFNVSRRDSNAEGIAFGRAESTAPGSPGGKKLVALSSPARVESVWRQRFARMIHSKPYIAFMVPCTIWVLGGEDVYMLHDPPVWLDKNVFSLSIVCAAVFLVDLVVRSTYEAGYFTSFWFWLDLIALTSLLPEVIWVVAEVDVFSSGAAGLARSGRAASAGARVVRILRILKLLKMLYELKKRNIRKDFNQLGDNSTSEISRKLEDYVTVSAVRRSLLAQQHGWHPLLRNLS